MPIRKYAAIACARAILPKAEELEVLLAASLIINCVEKDERCRFVQRDWAEKDRQEFLHLASGSGTGQTEFLRLVDSERG